MKKPIIIKKTHSKNCIIAGTTSEFYCPVDFFFGTCTGNKKSGHHYWLEMQCNYPDCKYRAVIKVYKISSLLQD